MYSARIRGSTLSFLSAFQCFVLFFSLANVFRVAREIVLFSLCIPPTVPFFFLKAKLFEVSGASWNAVSIFLEVLAMRVFFKGRALSSDVCAADVAPR